MLLPAAISFSTSRSRGLSTGPSGSARLRISPTRPAARLGATTSRPFAQSSTAFTSSALARLLRQEAGRALLQRAVHDRRLVVRRHQQHPGRQLVALHGGRHLGAVHARHAVVQQRHLRRMRPDRLERRQPVVGLGHHLDRSARGERADHPVAKQRMVVTHHHAHLFAGHASTTTSSVAQHRPVLPPIGGHVIHPCRRLIAGHTTLSRSGSLKSSPEHTGAKTPKVNGHRRIQMNTTALRPLLRPADRLGRNHRRRRPRPGRRGQRGQQRRRRHAAPGIVATPRTSAPRPPGSSCCTAAPACYLKAWSSDARQPLTGHPLRPSPAAYWEGLIRQSGLQADVTVLRTSRRRGSMSAEMSRPYRLHRPR